MKERLGTGGFGHVYLYQHQVCHLDLLTFFCLNCSFPSTLNLTVSNSSGVFLSDFLYFMLF